MNEQAEAILSRLERNKITEDEARRILGIPNERPLPQRRSTPFRAPTLNQLKVLQEEENKRRDMSTQVHSHVVYVH